MIEHPIVVTIHGHPAGQGSMRCVGRGGRHQLIADNRPALTRWRELVSGTFERGVRQRADRHQPVGVEVTFTVTRPAAHYGTGANSTRLRDDAPMFPATRGTGDLDKAARALLDAIDAAGTLHDDAQVVALTARKAYIGCPHTPRALDREGAWVRVYPVRERTAPATVVTYLCACGHPAWERHHGMPGSAAGAAGCALCPCERDELAAVAAGARADGFAAALASSAGNNGRRRQRDVQQPRAPSVRRFADSDVNEWGRLFVEGLSTGQIADRYGAARSYVHRQLLRCGVVLRDMQTAQRLLREGGDW